MKHSIITWASLTALSVALSACGGGGGSNPLPAAQNNAGAPLAPGTTSAQRTNATFAIAIPASGTSSAARSPKYVSAATQSIVISVAPATGGTATSSELDVTSSNCPNSVCTLTVSAPVGSDIFTITTFDAIGGKGNVLSSASAPETVVAYTANTFSVTLSGTIASLALAIDSANPPTGSSSTLKVTLTAYDAQHNQIIGTYAAPITLSGDAGLSFSRSSVPGSSTTVSATYDGVSRKALNVTATSGSVTTSSSVVPRSALVYSAIPGETPNGNPFRMVVGPDSNVYFGDLGPATVFPNTNLIISVNPGYIGQINPTTGAITTVPVGKTNAQYPNSGASPIALLFVGNDLYFAESQSGAVGAIKGAAAGGFTSANYAEQLLSPQPPAGTIPQSCTGTPCASPRGIALGADGKTLYVASNFDGRIAALDTTTFPSATPIYSARLSARHYTYDVAELSGAVWFDDRAFDGSAKVGMVSEGFASGAVLTEYNDNQIPPMIANGTSTSDISGFRFITAGPDGQLYFTYSGPAANQYAIQVFNPQTSTFSTLPTVDAYFNPDTVRALRGSKKVFFNDFSNVGVGWWDTSTTTATELPLATTQGPGYFYPQDVVQAANGDLWMTMDEGGYGFGSNPDAPKIGHLAFAQGWTVFPQLQSTDPTQPPPPIQVYGTGPLNSFVFGLGYDTSLASYTFTVTSNPTSTCAVQQPSSGHWLNTYEIVGNAAGSCIVTIADQNGRKQILNVQVTTQTASISSRRRINR